MQGFLNKVRQGFSSYDDGTLPSEVARNLRIMIISVLLAQLCFNATGGSAFTGYIKALGATDFMLGVLMAMPFCVRVLQIFTSYILERTQKRKLLLCGMGLVSRFMWIPIALVPLFIPVEEQALRLWGILVLYALSAITGNFIDSSFFSLAADVVPMRIRGRYFSFRAKLSMAVSIAAGLIVSFLLDNIYSSDGLLGYIVVFVIAGLSGAADIFMFLFMRFPPMQQDGQGRESLFSMLKGVLKDTPFMRLVFFWTVWSLSVNIAAPYFNVYMLEYLNMSYMQITLLCTIPANVFSFLLMQRWGGMMDSYGYKPVLQICAMVGSFIPIVWVFSGPQFLMPVVIAQMLSGAVWPAIDLSAQNTIMNASPVRNRSMYTAVYMVSMQLFGIALGFILGGFLLDNAFAPLARSLADSGVTWLGSEPTQYHFIMIVAMVLRFAAVIFFLPIAKLESEMSTPAVIREGWANTVKGARRNASMLRVYIARRIVRRRARRRGKGRR